MSLSNLIASRRAVHEAQDHGIQERQHRSTAAQVAGTSQQEHDRTQDIAQMRNDYMQANLGKGEPAMGQIEDWHQAQHRQQQQAPAPSMDAAKAERDWEAGLSRDQRQEHTQADNRSEMKVSAPKAQLPNLQGNRVLDAARQEAPSQELGAMKFRR